MREDAMTNHNNNDRIREHILSHAEATAGDEVQCSYHNLLWAQELTELFPDVSASCRTNCCYLGCTDPKPCKHKNELNVTHHKILAIGSSYYHPPSPNRCNGDIYAQAGRQLSIQKHADKAGLLSNWQNRSEVDDESISIIEVTVEGNKGELANALRLLQQCAATAENPTDKQLFQNAAVRLAQAAMGKINDLLGSECSKKLTENLESGSEKETKRNYFETISLDVMLELQYNEEGNSGGIDKERFEAFLAQMERGVKICLERRSNAPCQR